MNHHRRTLAALGLSTLMLVGGCNGDSNAGDDPRSPVSSSDSSPSASESTYTPPPPAKPPTGGWPEDKPATKTSAEKVARIWVRSYGKAIRSGDASRMRRLSLASCAQCTEFMDQITDVYSAGGVMKTHGMPFAVPKAELVEARSKRYVKLRLNIEASDGRTIPAEGAVSQRYDAQQYVWFFVMAIVDNRWRVKEMGFSE